jgi:hypothetical protein
MYSVAFSSGGHCCVYTGAGYLSCAQCILPATVALIAATCMSERPTMDQCPCWWLVTEPIPWGAQRRRQRCSGLAAYPQHGGYSHGTGETEPTLLLAALSLLLPTSTGVLLQPCLRSWGVGGRYRRQRQRPATPAQAYLLTAPTVTNCAHFEHTPSVHLSAPACAPLCSCRLKSRR